MISAHKARQARLAAAGARETDRLRAIRDEARQARELSDRIERERLAALRAEWARADDERGRAYRAEKAERDPELRSIATYPSIRKIIVAVAQAYEVSPIDMMSARRTMDVVLPRQIAMYLCKVLTLRSLPAIGRQFGGKDHTTILHAVRKIAAHMALDDAFRGRVEALRAALTEAQAE
jgi:chromosomal replication initiation ATPase DnaA